MPGFFFSFWWLIFPIGFFVFGAWDRWLAYKRSQDRLDLLRSYTSQGKDPPPELIKALQGGDLEDAPPPPAYDPEDRGSRRAYRRYHRHYWRYTPYGAWRSAIVTGAVAAGFWFAAYYGDVPGADWPFRLVAIIMSIVFVGNLVTALFASTFRNR
ncbi:MAG TPA: hypothetical protein VFH92_03175 [Phenylobacterium sp.]|nr:hypothetical protein [Phenylobacterium sp.]